MPFRLTIDQKPFQVEVVEVDGQERKFLVRQGTHERLVEVFSSNLNQYTLLIDQQAYDVAISNGHQPPTVFVNGHYFALAFERGRDVQCKSRPKAPRQGPLDLKASMPGKIVKILAKSGDRVEKGQPLLVLEAMKMENEICSPQTATVSGIDVEAGQNVEAGKKLLTLRVGEA